METPEKFVKSDQSQQLRYGVFIVTLNMFRTVLVFPLSTLNT